jgi:ubiquinone/menaquinone biosynthesis C-methylase UbiE
VALALDLGRPSARPAIISRPARSREAPVGTSGPDAWSLFWDEQGPGGRCLIEGAALDALDEQWAYFAASLPLGATVLDLGCGAGTVGRNLLGQRNDLQITGVDSARVPARSHPRLKTLSPVSMEALPFDDDDFDAAVSQFGIEYGKIADIARELERVLKRGARFRFLVHHRDSELVRQGSMRRQALRALTNGPFKSAFLSGSLQGLDQQTRRLMAQYPSEPMVKLVSGHFHGAIASTRAQRQTIWQDLAEALDPEIWMLHQLEQCSMSADDLGRWLVPLLSRMFMVGGSVVRRKSGEPIGWNIHGVR